MASQISTYELRQADCILSLNKDQGLKIKTHVHRMQQQPQRARGHSHRCR